MLRRAYLTVGVAGFGQLTGLQGSGGYNADSAGPRQIQLTGRLTFYGRRDR